MGNQHSTPDRFTEVRGEGNRGRILGVEYMSPSSLRFTHDSISCRFQDGHSMEDTFRQLMNGELGASGGYGELPPLVVMQHRGYWFVVRGNRRLYLYQKLERAGFIQSVKVLKKAYVHAVFEHQFSSNNMGMTVRIRGDPYLDQKLDAIIQQRRGDALCVIL